MPNTPARDTEPSEQESSRSDRAEADLKSLGELGAGLLAITSQLRPDGPPVDFMLLADYVDQCLDEGGRRRVVELVTTYRAWYEKFWEMVATAAEGTE